MKLITLHSILLIAACGGCGGPNASVQGTVTIDGQLARGGTVQFHPVDDGPTAYGSIAKDGSYSLRVGQGDLSDPNAGDVPLGDYLVTVVANMPSINDESEDDSGPPKPGARLTAEKYAAKETTDLEATVKVGRNVVPLELEGAAADAVEADAVEAEVESPETEAPTQPEGEADQKDTASPPDQAPADAAAPSPPEAAPEATPEGGTSPNVTEPAEPAPSAEEPTQ